MQVGFNAGDGEKFYALEGSQAPDVINIDKRSNIGVPGRFIFRTDGAEVTQPQCESFGKNAIDILHFHVLNFILCVSVDQFCAVGYWKHNHLTCSLLIQA